MAWPAVSRAEAAFLCAAATATAMLHLTMFGYPMLNPDETTFFAMQLTFFGGPGSPEYELGTSLGSHWGPLPVQFAPYIGALGAYASLPFSYALGPSMEAVRAYNMAVAISVQLAVYLVARHLFSRSSAVIAAGALGAFPFFVFFSRQGTMYDWVILAIALLVVYFGIRFVRGGSLLFLAAAVLSAWLMIWGYLYALWPVLGMLAALPFCVASARRRRRDLRRAALCAVALGLVGFAPFAAQFASGAGGSWLGFLLQTVTGDNVHVAADNTDVAGNLSGRLGHLHDLLTRPAMGLWGALHVHTPWNPFNPAFAILLGAGASVGAAAVLRRAEGWRRFAGLFTVLAVTVACSSFTVTGLNPVQLGVAVPFAFVLMGGGLGRATAWLSGRLERTGLRQWHLVVVIVAVVAASQAPHLHAGFADMAEEPGSRYMRAAGDLDAYLSAEGAVPVALDWWTQRSLVLVLYGDPVPVAFVSSSWEKHLEFNDNVRAELRTVQSPVDLEDAAFVMYTYPEELDCAGDVSPVDMRSNQCAQEYLVESLAERAGLKVETNDFGLPDGTPYYRVLRAVP